MDHLLLLASFGSEIAGIDGFAVKLAAALTAFTIIWKYLVRPFFRIVRTAEDFANALPALLGIAEEFKPNHGSSLKDAVLRIENRQTTLDDVLKTHIESAEYMLNMFGERITNLEAYNAGREVPKQRRKPKEIA